MGVLLARSNIAHLVDHMCVANNSNHDQNSNNNKSNNSNHDHQDLPPQPISGYSASGGHTMDATPTNATATTASLITGGGGGGGSMTSGGGGSMAGGDSMTGSGGMAGGGGMTSGGGGGSSTLPLVLPQDLKGLQFIFDWGYPKVTYLQLKPSPLS